MGCSYKFVALVKFAAQIAVKFAQMAELVDAHGSGPCAFGCGGSSPLLGTIRLKLLSVIFMVKPHLASVCTCGFCLFDFRHNTLN